MKLAAIDIGSNSIHMIIVDVAADGSFVVMDRVKDMIGLGRGTLERNFLDEQAMAAGRAALGKFVKLARRHGVDEVLAVATSAVRESLNGGDFIESMRRENGIDVRVITAVEEARLIALAVRDAIDLGRGRSLVIDIGGGSIEAILLEDGAIAAAESWKLGVIRLAERFLVGGRLTRAARRELEEHVAAVTSGFVAVAGRGTLARVVGTSGTILALGGLAADLRPEATGGELVNGRVVSLEALRLQTDRMVEMSAKDRARLPGVDERRADTIAVGAVALCTLLGALGASELTLCDRALREGTIADYLERNRARLGRLEALPSLRHRSVLELAERYGYDPRHSAQVVRFALQLFDRTKGLHRLGEAERQVLEHAALLHDVGTHIAYEDHHRHSYYLVKNGGLRGFSPDEVELLAGIVLYHRGRGPRKSDPCVHALGKKKRRVLATLTAILRVADGLDRSHFQVVRDLQVRVSGPVVSIAIDAGEDPELELWAAHRKGRPLEKALGVELRFVLRGAAGRSAAGPGRAARAAAGGGGEVVPIRG